MQPPLYLVESLGRVEHFKRLSGRIAPRLSGQDKRVLSRRARLFIAKAKRAQGCSCCSPDTCTC
jgi:hypothetical protein